MKLRIHTKKIKLIVMKFPLPFVLRESFQTRFPATVTIKVEHLISSFLAAKIQFHIKDIKSL